MTPAPISASKSKIPVGRQAAVNLTRSTLILSAQRASAFAPPDQAGSRTVNVDPRPKTLSTVRSPPISRQKWRLSTSPRPVPIARRAGPRLP